MNMNESEFENELRALRPSNPTPEMEEAIRRELRSGPFLKEVAGDRETARSLPRESILSQILTGLCWAAGGATAAVLALLLFQSQRNSPRSEAPPALAAASSANAYQETTATTELLKAEDGGLLYDKNEQPEEVLRYSSMERHAWENPVTGARVEVEVPREDVVLVPVSFQ